MVSYFVEQIQQLWMSNTIFEHGAQGQSAFMAEEPPLVVRKETMSLIFTHRH